MVIELGNACLCVCMYGCVYVCVCVYVGVCVCACGVWPRRNMPHAMTSGEGHCVRGLSTSVPKRVSADHHGNGWSATGRLGGACVCVWVCMCVCVVKLYVSKLYVCKWCVGELCVGKWCVSKWCVSKLCGV